MNLADACKNLVLFNKMNTCETKRINAVKNKYLLEHFKIKTFE